MSGVPTCRAVCLTLSLVTGHVQAAPATDSVQSVLEEVLVTAQRRGPERLQDVPMSISVIDSKLIDRKGLVGMNDYLRSLPSTSYIEFAPGGNNIIIRGVATDFFRDETTGIYIGDTPITNLGVPWGGDPDLKLVDIERVEVLRGPQGTLYGEGSIGGTVRIVPAAPHPERLESQVSGSFSVTGAEGGNNNTLEGMLNLPLLDGDAALRLVAYRHDNSGYYRNVTGSDPDARYWSEYFGVPALDKSDRGATIFTGWRAQFLWQPTPELSIKLMTLSQDIDLEGLPEGDMSPERFQQVQLSTLEGGGDWGVMNFDLSNLEVNYDFDAFSLLSTTSLVESLAGNDSNVPWLGEDFDVGAVPIFHRWIGPARSFNQELRLTSRQDGRLRYLAGFFYQDIDSSVDNLWRWEGDPERDPLEGLTILDALGEYDQQQTSVFGELTYDLTDRLTGSVGGRWFRYDQRVVWSGGGLWSGGEASLLTLGDGDGESYSLKLEYEANESTRIYGSFNQGFRFGGTNETMPPICDQDGDGILDGTTIPVSSKIASDNIDSYELGVKFRSKDGRFAVNATVFYVDWTDIPIGLGLDCGFTITVNAGRAESEGLEVEGNWEIAEGLVLSFAASWVNPRLAEDAENLGQKGDRLPGSPKHNLNLGIEQNFQLGQRDAFLRADLVSVGEYYDNLQQFGEASGGYTTISARVGVLLDDWRVELFVDNLTDEFAIVYIDWWDDSYFALRPRTIGVQAIYRFTGR
jgi:outer membrane receptor protein involved in Fe transport